MKLVCISDTHSMHDQVDVPPGDILIHAGDATSTGSKNQLVSFFEWFRNQPHEHKIFVAGNHDRLMERRPHVLKKHMEGIHYLCDSGVIIGGVKFWGSPWQPEFCNWAFNLPRGRALENKWRLIPYDTDVLITHGPPYGVGDKTERGELVGCTDLALRVRYLELRYHIFGHVHEGYGVHDRSINAAVCDERYRPINKPLVLECAE